jgi:hypothetical protein
MVPFIISGASNIPRDSHQDVTAISSQSVSGVIVVNLLVAFSILGSEGTTSSRTLIFDVGLSV